MLASQLRHLGDLEAEIERLDEEVARQVDPFEETVAAVDTIPGVGRRTAEVIVAEMGTDMEQFPTPGHLASWAGVCPGNNRSADKNKRSPAKKGNNWLKPALVEAARSAARTKTYLGAQYHRLARRIVGQPGRNGRGPYHCRHTLPRHQNPATLLRPGPPVFRGAGPHRHHPPGSAPTPTPRPHSHLGSCLTSIFIVMTM